VEAAVTPPHPAPRPLASEFLFRLSLTVAPPQVIGPALGGERRVFAITGGSFEGPRLSGAVLPGGGDWMVLEPDGTARLDVRIILASAGGALVLCTYQGLRHGPPEVLARMAAGEAVDPGLYYMRVLMRFEADPAGPYAWLNRLVAVGIGSRPPGGPVYDVHAVL